MTDNKRADMVAVLVDTLRRLADAADDRMPRAAVDGWQAVSNARDCISVIREARAVLAELEAQS